MARVARSRDLPGTLRRRHAHRHTALGHTGRSRCLAHRARALRQAHARRRPGAGHRALRRVPGVPAPGRRDRAPGGAHPAVAVERGRVPAQRPPAARGRDPGATRARPLLPSARRDRERAQHARPGRRDHGGTRCDLPRRHRARDRRLHGARGRRPRGGGPRGAPRDHRARRPHDVPRHRRLRLRALVAGTAGPDDAEHARGLRHRLDGAGLARLPPPVHRGHEARVRRPRGLLRRSRARRRADPRAPRQGVRAGAGPAHPG